LDWALVWDLEAGRSSALRNIRHRPSMPRRPLAQARGRTAIMPPPSTDAGGAGGHDAKRIRPRPGRRWRAAFPASRKAPPYGTPAFRVRSKPLLRMKDTGTLVLMCAMEGKELLMEAAPDIYYQTVLSDRPL
jgi:hypothetical protein